MFGEPMKRRRPYLPAALVILLLGIVALAVFGGAFGRGVAVGAFGSLALVGAVIIMFRRLMTRLTRTGLKPPTLPVKAWDYAMIATDVSGAPAPFEQFTSHVLLLNVWATWCAPCVAEMPSLFRLQERLADYDIKFAFVSSEKPEAVRKFMVKNQWDGPFYLVSGDLPECFRTGAIPATFVIDRGGAIVLRHVGAASWDDGNVLKFLQGVAVGPG
jgi:thiol-disulfide isomerase/thioredoxin